MKKEIYFFTVFVVFGLISAVCVRFLTDTTIYLWYAYDIHSIEVEGYGGQYNNSGHLEKWPENVAINYRNTVQKKNEFIESSDVATYLYNSGKSITGKIFRVISVLIVLGTLYPSLLIIIWYARHLIKCFARFRKRLFRRNRRNP